MYCKFLPAFLKIIYACSYFFISLLAQNTFVRILRYDVIHFMLLEKNLVHVDDWENEYKWCHL